MASQKSKRRSRKAHSSPRGAAQTGSAQPGTARSPGPTGPRARVAPKVSAAAGPPASGAAGGTRRRQREERERQAAALSTASRRSLGTYGERPKSVFSPIPVSEIAIFAGLIAVVVGLIDHGGPALTVGAIVCAFGVLEFTARDHFSGFRSHTTLLAAVPAIVVEILLAKFVGVPSKRILLLAPVVPVFALSFWVLRRSFASARHARVVKPPAA